MKFTRFSYYIMYKLIIYLYVGGGVKNDVAQFSHPSFIRLSDIGQYCCFWNIYELTGQFFNMSKGPMWVPYCYNLLQIDLYFYVYVYCIDRLLFSGWNSMCRCGYIFWHCTNISEIFLCVMLCVHILYEIGKYFFFIVESLNIFGSHRTL